MGRKRKSKRSGWLLYSLATLFLALLGALAWYWWDVQQWAPSEGDYPEQGVLVGEAQGLVGFDTVRALGGSFAYLEASAGDGGQDSRFSRNLAAARRAGLKVGALHQFDPCVGADAQSSNFVTMVPRDDDLLPPAIELGQTASFCESRISDAAVESELLTFINQVEMHTGKPVILKLSEGFEARYGTAMKLERDLWLERDRFIPRYAPRPWLLWSANKARTTEAAESPVEWVVVQP